MPQPIRRIVTPAVEDPGALPVGTLPGVGPALAETLKKLGLERVHDLWFHLPLRYEDRTQVTPIRDVRIGESAQVIGTVEAVERGFRYRPQLRVAIGDESRATLILRFFHFNRSQADQLAPGVGRNLRRIVDFAVGDDHDRPVERERGGNGRRKA